MNPALAERNAQIHLPKKLRRRRGDFGKDASFGLLSFVCDTYPGQRKTRSFSPPGWSGRWGGESFANTSKQNKGRVLTKISPPASSTFSVDEFVQSCRPTPKAVFTFSGRRKHLSFLTEGQARTKKSTRFCKIVPRCVLFFVRTCWPRPEVGHTSRLALPWVGISA